MWKRFVPTDARYAEQKYSDGSGALKEGTYFFKSVSGYCQHTPRHQRKKDCSDITDNIFTMNQLRQHLEGLNTYAPYQLSEGKLKWVCIDIDAYGDVSDKEIHAKVIEVVKKTQELLGKNSCLVEHSGSKGYHVWIFFDEPIDVDLGFSLGHHITHDIMRTHEINVEVYPKQYTTTKEYGNTVKLPLGLHQKTKQRCLFVSDNFQPHKDQWMVLQNVRLVSKTWVEENITPYVVEEKVQENRSQAPHCFRDILAEGCTEGIRDEASFKLACYLRDKGLPKHLAETTLFEWNKLNKPPIDEDQLQTKIDQGYDPQGYGWRPCLSTSFDHVCRSACPLYKDKEDARWFSKNKSSVGVISRD
jgi:hypothetical protein